jgi:hypothetical protein
METIRTMMRQMSEARTDMIQWYGGLEQVLAMTTPCCRRGGTAEPNILTLIINHSFVRKR